MSCAMMCGSTPQIWPMPTGRTVLGRKSQTLLTDNIELKLDTKFSDVDSLFKNTFAIFMADLKLMESAEDVQITSRHDSSSSEKRNKELDEKPMENIKKNCDIQSLVVKVAISTSPVIYVHLDMDESYNISIKSK